MADCRGGGSAVNVVLGHPARWTATFAFDVTVEQIRAYATATNETDPRLINGKLAPPLFATVPIRATMLAAFAQAMPEGLPPSVPRLAGEQDMRFHQPILSGIRVFCRARFMGISPRSSGTTLAYKFETRSASEDLVNEQYMTTFLPGVRWPHEVGERAPGHPVPPEIKSVAPDHKVAQLFDVDQTFRFSAASGDPSLMHLDAEYAKKAGLPGIIIHGLCTMAFVARAVTESVGGRDVLRLRRLAVRFSRPIFPGTEMTTRLWCGGPLPRGMLYFCEASRPDGLAVITNGLAEVST
jgi:acyl dehydratase